MNLRMGHFLKLVKNGYLRTGCEIYGYKVVVVALCGNGELYLAEDCESRLTIQHAQDVDRVPDVPLQNLLACL